MKSTVVDIEPETKDYIYMALGIVFIITGVLLMWDLLIELFRLIIGTIIVGIGIYLFSYQKKRHFYSYLRF